MAGSTGVRGTTLLEVVIALFVLAVGLLMLAGLAAGITRMATSAALNTELATLLSQRLEIVVAGACDSPVTGVETQGSLRVRWAVAPAEAGRRVTVWAAAPGARGVPPVTVSRFVWCP